MAGAGVGNPISDNSSVSTESKDGSVEGDRGRTEDTGIVGAKTEELIDTEETLERDETVLGAI